ncbi:hypothetical protein [Oceanobacillus jeddahense]|uniref:Spore coat protein YutH n=1 Tax=Oceanobacillus jeddahense TaxID=1462527 RepID=A0ABY5JR48_9BACI|nr:hypothetical protein [Oceanobacillus jeddahense]UUI01932.1 hypothetical protein NP439_18040 [Oceanobacillus jeddahense]
MPMSEMLRSQYAIQVEGKQFIEEREAYQKEHYYYFTIPAGNKEMILMEQATLAYFLKENGLYNVAYPIRNINGEWFTNHANDLWMVLVLEDYSQTLNHETAGKMLGDIHRIGSMFQYEPKTISSYGLWKKLWEEKLTFFEEELTRQAKEEGTSKYLSEVMDILPYIVGISENAIQYLRESEKEQRILQTDQSTVAFARWSTSEKKIIWADELVYDHPTRDIAEYIRHAFLQNKSDGEINQFLNDYQNYQPLSVFAWRLIFARLFFPIHLYDFLESGFQYPNFQALEQLLKHQEVYERRLARFYETVGVDVSDWRIPMISWL